tara:strand:- start:611 stop:811 length:201 start_codon:yes stop_codon:yes gene_type:complete
MHAFKFKDWQLKNSKPRFRNAQDVNQVINLCINPNKVYSLSNQITGTISSTQKKEFNFEDNYGGLY